MLGNSAMSYPGHCKGQKGYMPIAHNLNRPWLGQSKVVVNLGLHNLLIWRHMNLAVGKKVLLGFDISNMLKNWSHNC